MIILVDMDDTIENLCEAWVDWINDHYAGILSKRYSYRDLNQWDVTKIFTELTREQIFAPLDIDSFWETVRPYKDAIFYLKKLIEDGNKIYICTNSSYVTIRYKMDNVLFRYFPFITWNDVIICKDKNMLKADWMIDDNINNLIGGDYKKILFNQPHNEQIETGDDITRVYDWKQIYEIISLNKQASV